MKKKNIILGVLLGISYISPMYATEKPITAEHLVVMDFGALDTITALGAEKKVIALPQSNLPEYLTQYKGKTYYNTGGMKSPDLALIKKITPDYIIISGRQSNFYDELADIAPVYHFKIEGDQYLSSTKNAILKIGQIVGKEKEAEKEWANLANTIQKTKADLDKNNKKALVVLHNDGNLYASITSGFAQFIHDVLGVKAADSKMTERSVTVTDEYLKEINPDVIFVIDRSSAIGQPAFDIAAFKQSQDQSIKAIRDNKVVYLTPKLWYLSGNGLQSIQLQLKEVVNGMK